MTNAHVCVCMCVCVDYTKMNISLHWLIICCLNTPWPVQPIEDRVYVVFQFRMFWVYEGGRPPSFMPAWRAGNNGRKLRVHTSKTSSLLLGKYFRHQCLTSQLAPPTGNQCANVQDMRNISIHHKPQMQVYWNIGLQFIKTHKEFHSS